MARRRSRSVRRRKQRGGDILSSITSFFSRNPPSVPNPNDIQPAQPSPQPAPNTPKAFTYTIPNFNDNKFSSIKYYRGNEDKAINGGEECILHDINSYDSSTPNEKNLELSIRKYHKFTCNGQIINIPDDISNYKPMTGGRRRSRRRSNRKRSTRKQRR